MTGRPTAVALAIATERFGFTAAFCCGDGSVCLLEEQEHAADPTEVCTAQAGTAPPCTAPWRCKRLERPGWAGGRPMGGDATAVNVALGCWSPCGQMLAVTWCMADGQSSVWVCDRGGAAVGTPWEGLVRPRKRATGTLPHPPVVHVHVHVENHSSRQSLGGRITPVAISFATLTPEAPPPGAATGAGGERSGDPRGDGICCLRPPATGTLL